MFNDKFLWRKTENSEDVAYCDSSLWGNLYCARRLESMSSLEFFRIVDEFYFNWCVLTCMFSSNVSRQQRNYCWLLSFQTTVLKANPKEPEQYKIQVLVCVPFFNVSACRTNLTCAQSANQCHKSDHDHKTKHSFQVPLSATVAAIGSDTFQAKNASWTGLVNRESPTKIIFQQLPSPVPPISHPQALDLAGLLSKAG